MPTFFIVLFKINLVLILFVAVYYAVLRRLTYYGLNRFFLLLGILFSCCYPLMDLSGFFDAADKSAVPELSRQFRTMVTVEATPVYINYVYGAFFIGFVCILLRMVKQGISLYRIHRHSQEAVINDQPVQLICEPVGAFSFCRKIYINPSLHQQESLSTIIAHERVHVRQWHSIDILLVELGLLLYWFNPTAWLMRKAVKENLEFIADEVVLTEGADRRSYQYSLLQVTNFHAGLAITNDFNLVDLKQRIRMMNRKRSSRFMLVCYVILLPVLVVGCLAFTVSVNGSVQELLQPQELDIVQLDDKAVAQPANEQTPNIVLKINAVDSRQGVGGAVPQGRRGRNIAAQPLSRALQAPLYERPSTAGIQPGQAAAIEQVVKSPLKEVVVVGYASPSRRRPAEATGATTGSTAVREVGGGELPDRTLLPEGSTGGTQVGPIQRMQGVRLPEGDTSLQSVRIVQGYRRP